MTLGRPCPLHALRDASCANEGDKGEGRQGGHDRNAHAAIDRMRVGGVGIRDLIGIQGAAGLYGTER